MKCSAAHILAVQIHYASQKTAKRSDVNAICQAAGGVKIMYEPGRLDVQRLGNPQQPAFRLSLTYEVTPPSREQVVRFDLNGTVGEQTVRETFELRRDVACNFLSVISRRLRGYGLAPRTACVFSWHNDYDPLFDDLRRRLQLKPGDPVDLEWFLSRG